MQSIGVVGAVLQHKKLAVIQSALFSGEQKKNVSAALL
jgi:hypothetical protein